MTGLLITRTGDIRPLGWVKLVFSHCYAGAFVAADFNKRYPKAWILPIGPLKQKRSALHFLQIFTMSYSLSKKKMGIYSILVSPLIRILNGGGEKGEGDTALYL